MGQQGSPAKELPPMPLSDTAIRKVKPAQKSQRLYDNGGLYLEASPAGGKWWRLKYRYGGKEKRLSLGTYPDTGLADARSKRDAARRLLAGGTDPGEHRKAEKAAGEDRAANSLEVVARRMARQAGHEMGQGPRRPNHAAAGERHLPLARETPHRRSYSQRPVRGRQPRSRPGRRRVGSPRATNRRAGVSLRHRHRSG